MCLCLRVCIEKVRERERERGGGGGRGREGWGRGGGRSGKVGDRRRKVNTLRGILNRTNKNSKINSKIHGRKGSTVTKLLFYALLVSCSIRRGYEYDMKRGWGQSKRLQTKPKQNPF